MYSSNDLNASLEMLEIQQRVEHNETVPINRLPVELFCMILEYLDRSQLFEYESVCKKWAYFVAAFVGQKLVICRENKIQPRHWFFLGKRCPPEAVMVRDDLNVEPIVNSFCFGLKQLKICNSTADHYYSAEGQKRILHDLVLINRLTTLEVLEVSQFPDGIISLPNLKHLAICHTYYNSKPIFIDCPQLLSFKTKKVFYEGRDFVFSLPSLITHLYLDQYSEGKCLEQLTSLQYLSMTAFDYLCGKDYFTNIFSNFPKLKEISFRPGQLDRNSFGRNSFVCLFIELLKEKRALGRDDVTLTFCGVLIENEAQFECMYSGPTLSRKHHRLLPKHHRLLPKFYLENYSSLREPELRWIQVVHYIESNFPGDFHEKFRHVREIRVNSQVNDEDRLIEFILGFKRLESLGVKKVAKLGLPFYRKLARCLSIPYLAIWMESSVGLRGLNFLFEFKHLVCFSLLQNIHDRIVRRLFDHFECFELNYHIGKKKNIEKIKIRRSRKGAHFVLSARPGHLETFRQLNELLLYIDGIRSVIAGNNS